MDRRGFVRRLAAVPPGAWLCGGALPLAACAGVPYLVPEPVDGALLVPLAEIPEGSGVFVSVPGGDRPIYLHRDTSGELVALLARCTHRGCQPEPVADRMVCPCHGSEYDLQGNVLEGPADRPLARYDVTVRDRHALIRLPGGRP